MRKTCLLLLFVLLFGLSFSALAQDTVTGAFEGTVTDSQTGEAIANAMVEIGNRETGQRIVKNANARGRFYQGLLTPGIYTIRVTANGYLTREVEQRLFVTRTGEVVPVPVALDPAPTTPLPGATPAPTVTPLPGATPTPAAAPLTAQQTAVRAESNLVDAQRTGSFPDGTVDALPVGGTTITRSFDELTLFLPGVALPPPTYGNGSGPGQGPGVGSAGQFAINGLRSRGNNFTVDGSDNNDEDIGVRRQGFFSLVPQSIESIREYQVSTLLPSAVFGRNLGGQVNAVSRSGGRDFHGNLYGFFNSSQLNARNPFDSANGNGIITLRAGNLPVLVASQVAYNPVTLKTEPVNGRPLTTINNSGGKDSFTFGQGGFTLGGPVRRDRAFFFVSYERQVLNATQEGNFIVPTIEQRGVRTSGASGLFRNPFTNVPERAYPTTHQGDAIFSLFPFPNNPNGPFDANTFTQTLPASARGSIASGKYDQNFTLDGRPQSFTARYNFTQDRRILPYTGGAIFSTLEPRVRTQNLSLFLNSELRENIFHQARLSYGRTRLVFNALPDRTYLQPSRLFPNDPFLLNARLLENFTLPDIDSRPGFNSLPNTGPVIYQQTGATTEGFLVSDLGPVGQVFIAGFSPVGVDVFNFPQRRVNNTYQLADTLTVRTGSHTFAFGYDGRRSELNSDVPRNSRPMVAFQGAPQLVRTPLGNDQFTFNYTGNFMTPIDLAAASAASGFFQVLNTGTDAALNLRYYQHNLFLQDDWRIRRNLSLSLGLRYEYNTPVTEAGRRVENSFNDPALALVPGLSSFIGGRTRIYQPDFNNFAPRLGLAYSPRSDTVIRAGYGIYYDQILGAVVSQSRNVFPRFLNVNTAGGAGNAFALAGVGVPLTLLNPATNLTFVQDRTLNRLNPGVPLATQIQQLNLIASVSNAIPGASGVEATLPARNLRMPYAHQFSFGVERQVGFNLSLSSAYVGTVGNDLLRFTTPNLGPDAVLLPFDFFTTQTNELLDFQPQFRGIALPPGARIQPDGRITGGRPVSGVGGIRFFESSGTSYYHSLQLQARGRLANSFRFQAAYTLSRAIDDVSDVFDLAGGFSHPQNSLTFAGERSRANFDARHRFAYYFIYDVPSSNVVLRDLQLSGTGQFQTGTPFTVNSWTDVNMDGNITDRLDTLQGLVFTGDRSQPLRLAGDPRALLARIGEDGSIPRNFFRTSNFLDLNLALTKSVRFGERQRLILRLEAFNFINRANFGVPGRYIEGPEFGQALNTLTPARRIQFVLKYLF